MQVRFDMKPILYSRLVKARLPRVFAIFNDLENWPKFVPTILKVERLDDVSKPVGVGTEWRETLDIKGKETVVSARFIEFERNKFVVSESEGVGLRSEMRYEFTAIGDNTKVDITITYVPVSLKGRLLGSLMFALVRKSMVKAFGEEVEALARAAEAVGDESQSH